MSMQSTHSHIRVMGLLMNYKVRLFQVLPVFLFLLPGNVVLSQTSDHESSEYLYCENLNFWDTIRYVKIRFIILNDTYMYIVLNMIRYMVIGD